MPTKIRLTKQFIDQQVPGPKDRNFRDDKVRCLKLKLTPTDKTVWVLQFRTKGKAQRKLTLGNYPEIPPEEARRRATAALAEVAAGKDPVAERRAERTAVTFSVFASRYMTEHARPKKKESSADEDQRLLDKIILPSLGRKKLVGILRVDIQKLHSDLRETPYQANRVLALLSKMLGLAEKWDLRPDHSNPCNHVDRYKEEEKERFLSDEEYRRLFKVLGEAEADRTVSASATPRRGDRIEVGGEAFVMQGEPVRGSARSVWTVETRRASS